MRKISKIFPFLALISLLLIWTIPAAIADISVDVYCDTTKISTNLDTTTTHYVNFSINVTNTNGGANTNWVNASINVTFYNCTWSNWNFTNLTGDWEPINFYARSNATNFSAQDLNFNETWNKSYTSDLAGNRYLVINISQPCDLDVGQFFNLTLWLNVTGCSTTVRDIINISVNVTDNNATVAPTYDTDYAEILWAQTESLRVTGIRSLFNSLSTSEAVITIVGIIIIISAILGIITVVQRYIR